MLTSGGTTIAICASSPTAFTAAGYQALTFTDIDGVSDIGPIGRAFGTTSYNPLSSRDPVTVKGNVADTTSNLQWAYVPGDPGQEMLEEAVEDASSAYSFRLTWPNGRVRYFQALVLGTPINTGNADTLLGSTTTLFVRSAAIVTTAPTSVHVALELSNYSFVAGSVEGAPIGEVLKVPAGATVALSDSYGGAAKLVGLDLLVGPTATSGIDPFPITLQLYPAGGGAPTPTVLMLQPTLADLNPLTMAKTYFTTADLPGDLIDVLLGTTAGSTVTLVDSHGDDVALDGLRIEVGPSAAVALETFDIDVLETLDGAPNSSRLSTITLTRNAPTPPDGFVFVVDTDTSIAADTDGAYITEVL